ncbi:hypothetical protein ES704_01402 [subsurface metagenome]
MVIIAIIPCYNEARSAGNIITRASQYVDKVIVSDDNSTDNTIPIAKKAEATVVMNHTGKRGAGANTKRGIDTALALNPDIIVTLDGDGQHNPDEIPKVVKPIIGNKANMVVGSRFMPGHYDNTAPFYRRVGIGIITSLYNIFSRHKLRDAQSCFRAFGTKALEVATITERGFPFSVETLIKARHARLKIVEVPISCIYHKELGLNSSMNPVKQGISLALATIRWRIKIEVIGPLKKLTISIISIIAKPLISKGLGQSKLLRYIYGKVTKYLITEQMKTVQLENFKMKINTDERGLDGMTNIVITHTYEPITTKVFKSILKEGMNVIDVGACIGYHTVLASKLVGEGGKVWAIEPEPHNFRDLQGNIALNHLTNVIATEKAASDRRDKANLFVCKESSGNHSLFTTPFIKDKSYCIKIETIKLDDLIDGQRVDFIKTDTEGNEMAVLRGARRILKTNEGLILVTELLLSEIEAAGYSPQGFFRMLKQHFRFIYIIDERGKEIVTGTCTEAIKHCQKGKYPVNLLCSRRRIQL